MTAIRASRSAFRFFGFQPHRVPDTVPQTVVVDRMGRSVIYAGAAGCPQRRLPLRWCICDAIPPVDTRLGVHVLIHRQEYAKPSSTGRLIARAVSNATCQVFQRENHFFPASSVPTTYCSRQ